MKRRNFIKKTSIASGGVFFIPHFLKDFDQRLITSFNNKKIVIIQLKGGNDGLNTVIPYQNDNYYNIRKELALNSTEYFKVNDDFAFHNSLKAIRNLYDNGYISIINNVGYPNPNRSHFRSSEIWHSASDSKEFINTGWIGRYLDHTKSKSLNAIEIDQNLSLLLKGNNQNGLALTDPELFYKTINSPLFKGIINNHNNSHLNEHNLGYLYQTLIDAQSSSKYIYEKTKIQNSKQTYPKNRFGKQLKTISDFILSGLDTQIYYASLTGFDTHVNQKKRQKTLLETYAESIDSFVEDLKRNQKFQDVLILTFSEFGRRVKQNGSKGSDHGTANNLFIIGENLKKNGLYNPLPNLNNLDQNGDLKYDIDFRKIYATILNKWLKVNDKDILNKSFSMMDFI